MAESKYEGRVTAAIAANSTDVITLPAPNRGALLKLLVKQTAGTLGGFTVKLYHNLAAAEGSAADKETYVIAPTLTVAAAASFGAVYSEYHYCNTDNDAEVNDPTPNYSIYAEVANAAGTEITLTIAYTMTDRA